MIDCGDRVGAVIEEREQYPEDRRMCELRCH